MDLHTETHASLNISAGGVVMTYTYTGPTVRNVYVRVQAGSDAKPIAGGTNYAVTVGINAIRVSPDSNVAVSGGVTKTMLHSREFLLRTNDVITVTVDGAAGDIDIFTTAILMDVTPLTADQVYGTGSILIDHDYGGTDELRVVDNLGAGLQDAQIVAYLLVDYDAGNRGSSYIRGRTTTNVSGRWRQPIGLDPEDYVLVVSKTGTHTPEVIELQVT